MASHVAANIIFVLSITLTSSGITSHCVARRGGPTPVPVAVEPFQLWQTVGRGEAPTACGTPSRRAGAWRLLAPLCAALGRGGTLPPA